MSQFEGGNLKWVKVIFTNLHFNMSQFEGKINDSEISFNPTFTFQYESIRRHFKIIK